MQRSDPLIRFFAVLKSPRTSELAAKPHYLNLIAYARIYICLADFFFCELVQEVGRREEILPSTLASGRKHLRMMYF